MADNITDLEFITVLTTGDEEYIGVVQNSTKRFISIYDVSKITSKEEALRFIQMADSWWWNSGQKLPIDAFSGRDFDVFYSILVTIPKKALVEEPAGPCFSMVDYAKRIKKTKIHLQKKRT